MSQVSIRSAKAEKKQYTRPELVKHGAVESLTQQVSNGGCSTPVVFA